MGEASQPCCDVAIQGAGVAGLTLALELQNRGHAVRVIERCPVLSQVGAGIWMAPNPMQVFHRLGIAQKIVAVGWPIRLARLQDYRGFDLQVTDFSEVARHFGFETFVLYRAELQRILFEELIPGTVLFNREITEIHDEAGEPLEVRLSNGDVLCTKAVVGADGVHSQLRHLISLGGKIRYSGTSSYRAIARKVRPLPSERGHEAVEIWSKGCRIGISQIKAEDSYWFMTFDAPPGERSTSEAMHAHAASLFRSLFPSWIGVLEHTRADEIIRTDIVDLHPLRKWSVKRVGLIGDAAHAATPNLGQGGAMAVEDARSLAEAFAADGFTEAAWQRFETQRRPKVEWTVSTSRMLGRFCHLRNPVAVALRNALVRGTPKRVGEAQLRKIYTIV